MIRYNEADEYLLLINMYLFNKHDQVVTILFNILFNILFSILFNIFLNMEVKVSLTDPICVLQLQRKIYYLLLRNESMKLAFLVCRIINFYI